MNHAILAAAPIVVDRFTDWVLGVLEGLPCENCGQRLATHSVVGAKCQDAYWFSETRVYRPVAKAEIERARRAEKLRKALDKMEKGQ